LDSSTRFSTFDLPPDRVINSDAGALIIELVEMGFLGALAVRI
jgi:hypothetical protein